MSHSSEQSKTIWTSDHTPIVINYTVWTKVILNNFYRYNSNSLFSVREYAYPVIETYLQKMLIRVTTMSHIWTLRIDRIYKKFDGSNVITSNKYSTGLLNAISNQCEWQWSFSQVTTRLLLAIIWIEIYMATWLPHSITFNRIWKQKNWCTQLTNAHKDG